MLPCVLECVYFIFCFFFFSSRRRHTRCSRDWSSDVCSSDLSMRTGLSASRSRKVRPCCSARIVVGTSTATCFPACTTLKARSEEHTSELQSRLHLVCRLLLEKKKKSHFKRPLNAVTSRVGPDMSSMPI